MAYRPMPEFTGKEVLKLFRYDVFMGTITDLDSDWPWMMGQIELTPAAETYKPLWYFWTSEDNFGKEPPFEIPEDYDKGWAIVNEDGLREELDFLPAVHEDGEIGWR